MHAKVAFCKHWRHRGEGPRRSVLCRRVGAVCFPGVV